MPELPEVEAARRAIEENCIGKKIVKAIIADDQKVIDSVSPYDFESSLLHKTIVSARRKGKNLWLVLDSPPFPSFQFGMAGAIYIKGVAVTKYKRSAVKDTDEWPSKYSKLFIELDDGMEVSFTDKRRFAKVRLLKDPALVPPISELGPDALLELMPVDDFHQSLSKKKVSIKTLLLDQGFISGIGNWIADEVLYQARLHPQQIASSLSKESCATLLKCIKEVTEKAIEVGADSSQFPSNWIFHSREKKPGKAFVDGKTIDFITAGGRTTAYVPELQKLSGDQIAKVAGKPRKQAPKRKRGGDEDNESDNGDEDAAIADEPSSEEGDAGKKADSKKEVKPRGRGKKPPPKRKSQPSDSDNGDEDAAAADEALSEEGDTGKKADSKKEVKPRGRGKKPPPKRKSQPSDSDNGDEDAAAADEASSEEGDTGKKADSKKEVKPRGRGKKPAPKRKSQPSDSDNDDNVDADDDNVQTKEAGRVKTNNKQTKAAAAPKKKATSQKKKGN